MKNKAFFVSIVAALLASCGIADGETIGPGTCSVNNGGCSQYADCIPLSSNNRSCVCKSGYSGNGITCTQNTGGGGGGNTGGDEGQGFGNGPWPVTVNFPSGFTLNVCAGKARNPADVVAGGFDCLWNLQYDNFMSGTSTVSFTVPDLPQMSEPLRLYFNLRKSDGNYVFYLSSDLVFVEGGLSLTVKSQNALYASTKDTQRRNGCPTGCPNGRTRLR